MRQEELALQLLHPRLQEVLTKAVKKDRNGIPLSKRVLTVKDVDIEEAVEDLNKAKQNFKKKGWLLIYDILAPEFADRVRSQLEALQARHWYQASWVYDPAREGAKDLYDKPRKIRNNAAHFDELQRNAESARKVR